MALLKGVVYDGQHERSMRLKIMYSLSTYIHNLLDFHKYFQSMSIILNYIYLKGCILLIE